MKKYHSLFYFSKYLIVALCGMKSSLRSLSYCCQEKFVFCHGLTHLGKSLFSYCFQHRNENFLSSLHSVSLSTDLQANHNPVTFSVPQALKNLRSPLDRQRALKVSIYCTCLTITLF